LNYNEEYGILKLDESFLKSYYEPRISIQFQSIPENQIPITWR
jgi:hypothetical protein